MLPRRILIVDDEPSLRQILRDNLGFEGYRCLTAASASEALALVDDFRPHLALIDVRLNDGDGVMVAAELRQRPATSKTRVMFMTGFAAAAPRKRASIAAAGRVPILMKPFEWNEAIRFVEGHFNSPSRGRIVVDKKTREAWIDGRLVRFGDKRFDLLAALVEAAGPLDREQLHRLAWPGHGDAHIVDVTIPRLRESLKPFADFDIDSTGRRFQLTTRDED